MWFLLCLVDFDCFRLFGDWCAVKGIISVMCAYNSQLALGVKSRGLGVCSG